MSGARNQGTGRIGRNMNGTSSGATGRSQRGTVRGVIWGSDHSPQEGTWESSWGTKDHAPFRLDDRGPEPRPGRSRNGGKHEQTVIWATDTHDRHRPRQWGSFAKHGRLQGKMKRDARGAMTTDSREKLRSTRRRGA